MSNLVSAHNGYVEVYLDIGLVGLCLLVLVLISGYRRAGEAFRRNRELCALILAYLVTGVFYNITEAGFRLMSPSWIFPLLAVVSATGVTIGLFGTEKTKILGSSASAEVDTIAIAEPIPVEQFVYTVRRSSSPF
jgi:O-antigen ligase